MPWTKLKSNNEKIRVKIAKGCLGQLHWKCLTVLVARLVKKKIKHWSQSSTDENRGPVMDEIVEQTHCQETGKLAIA